MMPPSSRISKVNSHRDNCADDGLENTGDCGDDRSDAIADSGNNGALDTWKKVSKRIVDWAVE